MSGGCKNGKSTYAEQIACAMHERNAMHATHSTHTPCKPSLYYIATMSPTDDEDHARIDRHRTSRAGLGFETVEIARDIRKLSEICDTRGTFLLDSTTALLANEMFSADTVNMEAHIKISNELNALFNNLENIVIVSDYIYSDAAVYDSLTERYRLALAFIDRTCAAAADTVLEVCYGQVITYKNKLGFNCGGLCL